MRPRQSSGVWEGLVRDLGPGERYKFGVSSRHNGYEVNKADPFAFGTECPPNTASVVADLSYDWQDEAWMAQRAMRTAHNGPISIYEVHLGSFMRVPEQENRSLDYREIAPKLAAHVKAAGFTRPASQLKKEADDAVAAAETEGEDA